MDRLKHMKESLFNRIDAEIARGLDNVDTKELIKNTTNSYVTFVDVYTKVFETVDTSMNRKLKDYNNESEYVYIAYVKGMLLFDSLHEILGHDKFIKGLQTYFKDNQCHERAAGCPPPLFAAWAATGF